MEEWHISSEYDFLKSIVEEKRATGRSTRIVDRIIQDFFEKPIGTIIPIYDHFNGVNFNYSNPSKSDWCHTDRRSERWGIMRQADRNILKRVEGRLRNEHCGVKYKIITGNPRLQTERNEDLVYSYAIIRKTPTNEERLKLEQMLKESKDGKI